MQDWHDFFVATAGAAAALVGFIIVGISINLQRILAWPQLPNRSLEALFLPVTVLLVSCCGLVPNQSVHWLGGELMGCWLLTSVSTLTINLATFRKTPVAFQQKFWFNVGLTQLAILPFGLAGSGLLQITGCSFYWVVVAILLCVVKTIFDAWILLIEINR